MTADRAMNWSVTNVGCGGVRDSVGVMNSLDKASAAHGVADALAGGSAQ